MTPVDTHRHIANQLIWTLAREVVPGDVVVVGVGTPIATAAALLARELLDGEVTVIVANSVDPPVHDIAVPMVSAGAVSRLGVGTYAHTQILDAIHRGRITLQFLSPAQVDGAGRLNGSRVPARGGGLRRLPGALATGDVSLLVGRIVAYRASHSPRFLPNTVPFTSGAGHNGGPGWRTDRGITGAGVRSIVTDRAVLRRRSGAAGFELTSVHSGVDVAGVVADTGFDLAVSPGTPNTEPPGEEAIRLLDEVIDPHGVRCLEIPEGRAAALQTLTALAASRPPPVQ